MRAIGLTPSCSAAVPEPTITAAAPSLSCEALPAVTPPSGLNAGLSLANPSTALSGRMPSSRETVLALSPLPTVTGTTSSSNAAACHAAAAR